MNNNNMLYKILVHTNKNKNKRLVFYDNHNKMRNVLNYNKTLTKVFRDAVRNELIEDLSLLKNNTPYLYNIKTKNFIDIRTSKLVDKRYKKLKIKPKHKKEIVVKEGIIKSSKKYEFVNNEPKAYPKLHTTGMDFHFKFSQGNSFDDFDANDIIELFENMVKESIEIIKPEQHSKIVISMNSEYLLHHISSKLHNITDVEDLCRDISEKIQKILQSNIDLRLDENIEFNVFIIDMPYGGNRLRLSILNNDEIYKKKCIIHIKNSGNDCLGRAIITAKAKIEKPFEKEYDNIKRGRKIQKILSDKLYKEANIDNNELCGINEIKTFEKIIDYEINIVDLENNYNIIYPDYQDKNYEPKDKIMYLLKNKNHFDVITSMSALLCRSYFCDICKKGYSLKDKHNCKNKCNICCCYNCDSKISKSPVYCKECFNYYPTKLCYENHKNYRCERFYNCPKCRCRYSRKDMPYKKHIQENLCYTSKCGNCKEYVIKRDHKCYMKMKDLNKPTEKYIFGDFETQQESGTHIVAYASFQYFNNNNSISFDNIESACKWMIQKSHKDYTIIFHNGRGFDFQFILNYCIRNNLNPFTIYNGSKIMYMSIGKGVNIRFVDSLNFMTMPLSDMPKTFDIDGVKKGYFPHYFNKKCNDNYIGDLPNKNYFGYKQFSKKKRKDFLIWYLNYSEYLKENNLKYDFQKELKEYCDNDVYVLRKCCEKFRDIYLNLPCSIDPFTYITIASVCMNIYKHYYLPENTIGIVKPVRKRQTFSKSSIMWLDWIQRKNGLKIQHSVNGGEKKIGKYFVDGYCDENKTIYEYNGCFWHGCNKCYCNGNVKNEYNNKSMKQLFREHNEKVNYLKNMKYNVEVMWECDFKNLMKKNKDIENDFQYEIVEPLNPRDAFFGGRTNACKLKYSFKEKECGKYVDITSLYPSVNYYDKYPVGHPEIITEFKNNDIEKYYGFVKCKTRPPDNLYHPVLPCKINNKLMFPLCGKCASCNNQDFCNHNENEKSFIGTWTTIELMKALNKGYRILKLYEVWNFENSSDNLFKEYVETFLKIKQESSGFPDWVKNEDDKQKYINDYYNNQGIKLDYEKIIKNKGLRSVAKLCLNSLWGKFGQRDFQNCYGFCDYKKYLSIIYDDNIDQTTLSVYPVNENTFQYSYDLKKNYSDGDYNTNIYIACFTTSNARLRLYQELEKLDKRVLYFDTDSIIYISLENEYDVKLGDNLGEWTDELEGNYMVGDFVSGGPKNYAYRTNDNQTICKIKGFSLNYENSKYLNYENMLCIITGHKQRITIVEENKITRNKLTQEVKNKYQEKDYGFVYDKRKIVFGNNIDTIPFGYNKNLSIE